MKILKDTWGYISNPAFLLATIVVAVIVVPIAVKALRKVPGVGDKLPTA